MLLSRKNKSFQLNITFRILHTPQLFTDSLTESTLGPIQPPALCKTQTVSEPANMALAMGAVTRPPEPPPSEQPMHMSAASQLCGSVTLTSVRDSPNADRRRSCQKPISALPQSCRSMTPTPVGDRLGSVTPTLVSAPPLSCRPMTPTPVGDRPGSV